MAMVHHWQKSGQELKQDWNRNHGRLGLPDSLLCLVLGQLSYATQDHLPREGNTHSGHDPPINDQNNSTQIRWQTNLTWSIGPLGFSLPKTLGCIKLITTINKNNEFTSHRWSVCLRCNLGILFYTATTSQGTDSTMITYR